MIIRCATHSDYSSLIGLYTELHDKVPFDDDTVGRNAWDELIAHPGTKVFCVEIDNKLVAATTIHVLPNMTYGGRPYGLIENVIISQNYRRLGIGSKVMQQAIDHAWSKKCYKIMLLTGQHREAAKFYEKLGFSSSEKTGMIIRSET